MSAVGRPCHFCRFTLYSIGIGRCDTSCKCASCSDHGRIAASRHRAFVICHDTCRIGIPCYCTGIATFFDDAVLRIVSGDPGDLVSARYGHMGSHFFQCSRVGSRQCGGFISALEDACQGKVLHRALVVRDQSLAVFQVKVFNGVSRTVNSSCKARVRRLSADAGPDAVVEIQVRCQYGFAVCKVALLRLFGKPRQFCRRSDLVHAVFLLRRILGYFTLPSVVVLFRIIGFHSSVLPCQHRVSAVDPAGIGCKAVSQVFAGKGFQLVGSFGGCTAALYRAAVQIADCLVFVRIEYFLYGSGTTGSLQPSCYTALCGCFHNPGIICGLNDTEPKYSRNSACRWSSCSSGRLYCS